MDHVTNNRMHPRVIVYPSTLSELNQTLHYSSSRCFDEITTFYEDIEFSCLVWEDRDSSPRFNDFDTADVQDGDYTLCTNVASRMNLAEHGALAGHMLYLEDGPEVANLEQKEDQGQV
jgi:hypothetical protein